MAVPLYSIRGLRQTYGGRPALQIDALDLEAGKIYGVIGPNGSGKSTLLRLLGFIEGPSRGAIRFQGRPARPFDAAVRGRVALLPQEPFLLKRRVRENVAYGVRLFQDAETTAERVEQALSAVGLDPREFSRRPHHALSGGEAQRVALAARLALRPTVLLLDEPTANVDAASAQRVQEAALEARRRWGTTLVIASHDWSWLNEISDALLHLFQGRLIGDGRETVLFGPWVQDGTGLWGRRLSDGQHVRTMPPPRAEAAAVVRDVRLVEAGPSAATDPRECRLSGTVVRLSLEKAGGRVCALVRVAGLLFPVVLPAAQAREAGLAPGAPATLAYDWRAVQWV